MAWIFCDFPTDSLDDFDKSVLKLFILQIDFYDRSTCLDALQLLMHQNIFKMFDDFYTTMYLSVHNRELGPGSAE